MECINAISTRHSRPMEWECTLPSGVPSGRLWTGPRRLAFIHHHASWHSVQYSRCISMVHPVHRLYWGHSSWRACAASVNLDVESSLASARDHGQGTLEVGESEELIPKQLGPDELKALLADSERAKLIRKLSDANQYNRFLKRQLQSRDDTLVDFKAELAVLELELQALVGLAEEVADSNMPIGSRKINGKYIQSHLLSRLEVSGPTHSHYQGEYVNEVQMGSTIAITSNPYFVQCFYQQIFVHQKVKEQIKDVDSLKFKEVTVVWVGMAESVQVMGSFDGWSQGEDMSPEYSGYYARFSATLKLRPGRYEIKFLVDGEWRLSPEFPTVGEGMTENNLLIVS